MAKFYKIITYGCQMNVHESEKLAGVLSDFSYKPTEDEKQADVILFNTCCIREAAEHKVYGNIGALKNLKAKNKDLIIAVCGCMAQKDGTAENIIKKFPFVDIVFGTHNVHLFKDYLASHIENKKRVVEIWQENKNIIEGFSAIRNQDKQNAYVNIMYGCNNFCTYCIVPYVRGREKSREVSDIADEVSSLVNEGYKTITLLGQNVNSYGNDKGNGHTTFAQLLTILCKIPGDFRIKFLTSHPKDITFDLIETIARESKLSKMIHLPVQSGSNKILKSMNRNYTREHYLQIIEKIKSTIKNVSLTTDIIVGFPGESDEDFAKTCDLVKEVGFNNVFGFMYSKRSGTKACDLPDHLPLEVKNKRVNELLNIQKQITKENLKNYIGKVCEVLIIEKTENGYKAVLDNGKDLIIEEENLQLMQYVDVKIVNIKNNKLFAKLN